MSEINEAGRPTRLTTTARIAAEVLGTPLQTIYRLISDGMLRIMPGPGRKRILTTSIETISGRRLTEADFIIAEERATPKRDKELAYLAQYRAKRAEKAEKRISKTRVGGPNERPSNEKAQILRVQ